MGWDTGVDVTIFVLIGSRQVMSVPAQGGARKAELDIREAWREYCRRPLTERHHSMRHGVGQVAKDSDRSTEPRREDVSVRG